MESAESRQCARRCQMVAVANGEAAVHLKQLGERFQAAYRTPLRCGVQRRVGRSKREGVRLVRAERERCTDALALVEGDREPMERQRSWIVESVRTFRIGRPREDLL